MKGCGGDGGTNEKKGEEGCKTEQNKLNINLTINLCRVRMRRLTGRIQRTLPFYTLSQSPREAVS